MYIPNCHIAIGAYKFDRCSAVEIEKSTQLVASTAKITLPITAVLVNEGMTTTVETSKLVKVGDVVQIRLAYDGVYDGEEFRGYVKRVNYKIPLEIECEDIWPLRRKNINQSWKTVTLEALLQEIVSGTGIDLSSNVPGITLSPYSIKNATAAFALQKIRDEYGLTAYINRVGKLYVGLAYTDNSGQVNYTLNGSDVNVINADDLKYKNKDDVILKVKAIGIKGDNTRTEVEIGDKDGELRTLFFYNVTTADGLRKLATQEMNKLKFNGYDGKITTFLIPVALPGMKAVIVDEYFPERQGSYYVESVKTTWGIQGARREIELGIKLD